MGFSKGFGFRFLPGQSDFLTQDLKLPSAFDRLSFLSNALGLEYSSLPPFLDSMLPYCCSGAGLRSLVVNESINLILVEVITYCDGSYGRFLVLVSSGIGCTLWYGFVRGSVHCAPEGGLFTPFNSYDPFFNALHSAPGFQKISFLETNADLVSHIIGNEHPFAEIMIPASGNALKSVSIGVIISFFIAVGIVPHAHATN